MTCTNCGTSLEPYMIYGGGRGEVARVCPKCGTSYAPIKDSQKINLEVEHPSHYNQGKIEVIEFIEDQKLGYHLGNAVKYICRAGKKNPEKFQEDLAKAIWYIQRAMELKNPSPRRPNEMNP